MEKHRSDLDKNDDGCTPNFAPVFRTEHNARHTNMSASRDCEMPNTQTKSRHEYTDENSDPLSVPNVVHR